MTLRYYADYAAIVLALQSGEADMTLEARYQGSQPLFDNPRVRMQREPSSAYRALHLRVDTAPLDSPLVRRAIALPRPPALVQGLYSGRADVGNDHAFAPVYPTHPGTAPDSGGRTTPRRAGCSRRPVTPAGSSCR